MTADGQFEYLYDAWNRLVEVRRHGPLAGSGSAMRRVAVYRYDGLGHRVYKKVENSGGMDREEYYYYSQRWQLLEIAGESNQAIQQFVWGSQYIDEAICMDVDTDSDGDCTDFTDTGTNPAGGARRFFYMQDANWNVIGLTETTTSGPLIRERYEYDPYGTVRIYKGHDPALGYETLTVISDSLFGNPIRYAGYFHDNDTNLGYLRRRVYSPRLQRLLQRDPIGYSSHDINLYLYVGDRPIDFRDPTGLTKCSRVCEDAKDQRLDEGDDGRDDGGVICCLGKAYSCVWATDTKWHSKKAFAIYKSCVQEHEDDHRGHARCPSFNYPVMTRSQRPAAEVAQEECMAYAKEVWCLDPDKCGDDEDCRREVQRVADIAIMRTNAACLDATRPRE